MSSLPTQNTWRLLPVELAAVEQAAAASGVSRVTARVLASRGLLTADSIESFMSPDLERDWLGPDDIPGMREVADRVAAAVLARERIVVFGDFDLDGISAAAVAARGLAALGADVVAMVPHRFNEGYGLSAKAIERMMPLTPQLVVTVDCGISAAVEVGLLRERGVDVVVTDHHEPGDGVPSGIPVANPKLVGQHPSASLAGAGVALKLVHATGVRLGHPSAWRELTDIAMLGTIADIVPLVGENRALVADGVRRVRRAPRTALAALCSVAGVSTDALTADNVAFHLAPRLNAAGRIADPVVALDLLMSDDAFECERLANTLDEHNRVRQATEADLSKAAEAQASRVWDGERALVLAGDGWHDGVKGIVASRLAGAYGVPTILFSVEDGVARGSGRSVGTVDLFRALESCADMLDRFGGHAAAVGLSLPASDVPRFTERLLAHMDALPVEQFVTDTMVDAEVHLSEVSVELGAEIDLLAPFGHGNRRPLLATHGVLMSGRQRVGKNSEHFKFDATDGAASVPAIAFRCRDIDRLIDNDAAVDVAFELQVDEWRGRRRAQMLVRDVRAVAVPEDAPAAALVEDLFEHADEILAREAYSGIEDAASFHTKLAGVTFEGRQSALERLESGCPLRAERQPDNPYDPNAIAVFDPHGTQVGFFNRKLAAVLAPVMDAGVAYDLEVSEVTGGDGDRSLGVNVVVFRRDADDEESVQSALREQRRAELAALVPDRLEPELIKAFIGDRTLHDAQRESLDHLAAGRSTLTVMATGRGKSLIFHLHAARTALSGGGASIFVYPLRALVADQAFHLREVFAAVGLAVKTVTGESSPAERDEAFAALGAGSLDVVLTTPEFLDFHAERFAASGRVAFVVVDEAHHVGLARMGHRPSYARLGEAIRRTGASTVLAVTATASDDVADTIQASLGIAERVLDPTVRDNLRVVDARDCRDKDSRIAALVSSGDRAIIYVNSRDKSVQIARALRKRVTARAMRMAFYNAGLSRAARHAVENAFRSGDLDVVVATSAFGEGVNIPDVRHVVMYHLPFNEVEFNQMAGRAGRDGAAAQVHLLFGGADAKINELILGSSAPEAEALRDVYRVLRAAPADEDGLIEMTNAQIADEAARVREARRKRGELSKEGEPLGRFDLDERGASTALGILRELGYISSEGTGGYRRIRVEPSPPPVELTESVRYAEGLDEIEQFKGFRSWVLTAEESDLLARFNRPILPTQS